MTELLPCPFCGGEVSARSVNGGVLPWVVEERGGVSERYYTTCTLWCDTCGAQVEGYAASDETAEGLYKQAIENCYNAWNTRAERTCYVSLLPLAEWWHCSACGEQVHTYGRDGLFERPNYCPNCGAKVVCE